MTRCSRTIFRPSFLCGFAWYHIYCIRIITVRPECIYRFPASSRCRPDILPASSRCRPDILPASSRCRPDIVPTICTTHMCYPNVGPTLGRPLPDVCPPMSARCCPGGHALRRADLIRPTSGRHICATWASCRYHCCGTLCLPPHPDSQLQCCLVGLHGLHGAKEMVP